ncbi:AfsR/SARP family transcriptional regulator [Micromonospora parathelypteridis]|uniref:AfsR/SARP family transcriptional regulator n=1 Tax=Micromonospora parathelypteridis TaxID=1839617 RepID=UPI0019C1B3D4|nr:AfsR/SARP family transcriptional regulator [Micromonospora parathelypteridis]GGO21568.1 SARP family transcriptional regulator [Micromonospora parathelypteridis]
MWFRILGPLELIGVTGPVSLTAARQSIVLSTLLLESSRIVSVERLIDTVWPDKPPTTARGQIQICVSSLRSTLAMHGIDATIHTKQPGYQIEVDPTKLDLLMFERAVAAGRKAASGGRLTDAAQSFAEALSLWHGEPFAGIPSPILQAAAASLLERRIAAIEEYIDLRMRLHQHQETVGELVDLVERYPLRERLRAQLMLALFRCDRRADALEVYRDGRRILIDDLGLEPGEQLRLMEKGILSDDPDLRIGTGIGGGPRSGPVQVPRMLPIAQSDMTGHAGLIEAMRERLLSDASATGVPMVAISGRGGVGKTSLATHVAHALSDAFPDGQLYANMHGVNAEPAAPADVIGRFLRAMGVLAINLPEQLDERAEMFRTCVADRRILVVLDNCSDENQVRPILPATAGCAVILTSRHRLSGLSGAYPVEVDVLGLDHALELLGKMLGRDRIHAEESAAISLVRFCGGLPLALRVAGARLVARPHWAVSDLVDRLSDERRRLSELAHGGLDVRANLALSYRALSPPAQRLFRLLSQASSADFGGWICAPLMDCDPMTAGDLLDELVEARLVEVEHGRGSRARFRLHDLVRAYAREQLEAGETEAERLATARRLVGAWLFLAERAHRAEYGGDHTVIHGEAPRWRLAESVLDKVIADSLAWYDTERLGLLAAVRLAAEMGLDDACWDLALASVTLFENRRYFGDWRTTHELALEVTARSGNRRGRAAMLSSLGSLALFEQRHDDARPLLTEATQLFGDIGEDHGYALALRMLAFLDRITGKADAAMRGFEDALGRLRDAGDHVAEAHVMSNIAQLHLEAGDREAAAHDLKLALAAAERANARRVHAQVLCRLGDLHLTLSELNEAERAFQDALDLVLVLQDRVGEAHAKHGLASVALRRGRHAEAEAMLSAAAALAAQLNEDFIEARISLTIAEFHQDRGQREQALRAAFRAQELFLGLHADTWYERAVALVRTIEQAALEAVPPLAGTGRDALSNGAGQTRADLVDPPAAASGEHLAGQATART